MLQLCHAYSFGSCYGSLLVLTEPVTKPDWEQPTDEDRALEGASMMMIANKPLTAVTLASESRSPCTRSHDVSSSR